MNDDVVEMVSRSFAYFRASKTWHTLCNTAHSFGGRNGPFGKSGLVGPYRFGGPVPQAANLEREDGLGIDQQVVHRLIR
jgi:hypothetical protein